MVFDGYLMAIASETAFIQPLARPQQQSIFLLKKGVERLDLRQETRTDICQISDKAALKPALAAAAKKRQAKYYGNQYQSGLPHNLAEVQNHETRAETRDEIAQMAGVSHDTIAKVYKSAT